MITHRQTWQIPLCILLSLPLWQSGAGHFLNIEQGPFTPPVRQDKSFTLEGLEFTQTTQGFREVIIRAKRLHSSSESDTITLEDVNANRFGKTPLHIVSGSAAYDPNREIVTLMDEVLMEAADLVIKTPVMRYLVNYDTIKSAAEVSVTGTEIKLTGTTFMYNLNSGDMRIGKRVNFLYTPAQL